MYKYKKVIINGIIADILPSLEENINKGWEIVSILTDYHSSHCFHVFLKKQIKIK